MEGLLADYSPTQSQIMRIYLLANSRIHHVEKWNIVLILPICFFSCLAMAGAMAGATSIAM